MLLYIIRHGDPIYDPDCLTPKGHLQAAAVAKRLARHGIDRIYASPMIRAQQTAQPLSELLHLPVNIEDWTSEARAWEDFSVYIGGVCTWFWLDRVEELVNDGTVDMRDWYNMPALREYAPRFKSGLERIARCSDEFLARHGYRREGALYRVERPNDERVAVFCHEGFGKSWMSHLMSVPLHLYATEYEITHTGVVVVELRNTESGLTRPKCLAWSDMSHIYAEGLPMQHNNGVYI